jgi:hypothetical protein
MQPLSCSASAPYGIHLSIRDNRCARCGWTAPSFSAALAFAAAEEEEDGASGTLEEGGSPA